MARAEVDEDLMDELEEILITSDIGMDTTMTIMERLRDTIKNDYITSPEGVKTALKKIMTELVDKGRQARAFCRKPAHRIGHRHKRRRQDYHHRQVGI